jgi:polar amino acid transport system substrate-binding protein
LAPSPRRVGLAFGLAALAAAAALRAAEAPAVRVVTEDFPPYSFEQAGVVRGAATSVVRAVFERAGLPCTIEVMPWKRALDTALHERNTFIYVVARIESREKELAWVGKICDRKLALYCLKERDDLLGRSPAELPAATFAVVQGDASVELLRKLGVPERSLHLLRDARTRGAPRHVLEGRSDFFVSNPLRFEHGARGTELEGRFREHSVLWEGDGYYLAANPASDPALLARVHDAFAALQVNGSIKALFERARSGGSAGE